MRTCILIETEDLLMTLAQILCNTGKYSTPALYVTSIIVYRLIPEFISRLPSITTLTPLTIPDLRRILTEVKGSLVSQYQALFGCSGVEIRFTSAALDEICKKASERGGGARGLRGIMVSHYFKSFGSLFYLMPRRKHCF